MVVTAYIVYFFTVLTGRCIVEEKNIKNSTFLKEFFAVYFFTQKEQMFFFNLTILEL